MKLSELERSSDETTLTLCAAVRLLTKACQNISKDKQMIFIHPKVAVSIAESAIQKLDKLGLQIE